MQIWSGFDNANVVNLGCGPNRPWQRTSCDHTCRNNTSGSDRQRAFSPNSWCARPRKLFFRSNILWIQAM